MAYIQPTQIEIEKLKEAEDNPNRMTEQQLQMLEEEIKKEGFDEPLVVVPDEDGKYVIVSGNHRYKVAKNLGYKTLPCVVKNWDKKETLIHLIKRNSLRGQFVDTEFTKTINKLASYYDEDYKKICDAVAVDMKQFSKLYNPLALEKSEETTDVSENFDVNKELEAIEKPKTKPGDIITLGNHRLMCGDSTNLEHLNKLLEGEKVDLITTDPPYLVDYQSAHGSLAGDDRKGSIKKYLQHFPKVCEGAFYIFAGTMNIVDVTQWVRENTTLVYPVIIVWVKEHFTQYYLEYKCLTEFIYYGWFKKRKWNASETQTNVWYVRRDSIEEYLHPTQKPVELYERMIKNSSDVGDRVLDPYAGSGSALIACEKLKRKCYLMEIDPKFCDVIINRYHKFKETK